MSGASPRGLTRLWNFPFESWKVRLAFIAKWTCFPWWSSLFHSAHTVIKVVKRIGIAGASYIHVVQAALPCLLGAASTPGAAASEKQRRCIKLIAPFLTIICPSSCAEDD